MRLVALFSVLVCLAAEPQKWPIRGIAVEGNSAYSREQIVTVSGLRPGQVVGRQEIEAARDRLAATGAFEKIEFQFGPAADKKGYDITFRIWEAGPFYPVKFDELGISDAAARAALKRADPLFGERIPATSATLARYAKVLEAELASAGKPQKVAGRLTPDDSGALAAVFRPDVPLPRIARVRFTGNTVVHGSQLENAMNPVAIGQPYRENRFRMLLDATVRSVYEMRGRPAVEFPKIDTEKERGSVEGLVVTVAVNEGESYSLGEVQVEGADNAPELLKAANLKAGDVFNIEEVRSGATRIEKRLRRDGYMGVKTDVRKRLIPKLLTVDVTIAAQPGEQYRFGKLVIQGLDILTEPYVRNMWTMKAGQPFNADYPEYFLGRLREDGVFDNLGKTESKLAVDEANRAVDVTLVFRGAPPPPKPERK